MLAETRQVFELVASPMLSLVTQKAYQYEIPFDSRFRIVAANRAMRHVPAIKPMPPRIES
jgi:hypothetical protein